MAHKMMNAEEVKAFGKPVKKKAAAKKGGRRTQIQETPEENAEIAVHYSKRSRVTDYDVTISDLRAIMDETVSRVLHEINPSLLSSDTVRMNTDELSYVLMLSMVCGAGLEGQSGLKIRDATSGELVFCKEHAD